MGDGDAAGFFGVIGKISLGIFVGVVTDDLDGTLVSADGSVGTQTPEFGTDYTFRCRVKITDCFQGGVGDIVFDSPR